MNGIKKKSFDKKHDLLVVITLNLIGFIYAIATHGTPFGSVIYACIAVALPGIIYMAIRRKKNWKKIIVFTLVFGALYGFILEFIAEFTNTWNVPYPTFHYKILGVLPLDNVIGHMIMAGSTAIFYEHFIEVEHSRKISHNIIYGILPGVLALFAVLLIYKLQPSILLNTSYLYIKIGLVAVIPPILLAYRKPIIFKRMLYTGIYFFFIYLIFDIIGVRFQYWIFNGDSYIGWIDVLGSRFPFEELIFWMMFYAATLVSFYEVFIDGE